MNFSRRARQEPMDSKWRFSRWIGRSCLLLLLFLSLLVRAENKVQKNPSFEVQGVISAAMRRNGRLLPQPSVSFQMRVGESRWALKLLYPKPSPNDYSELVYDGKDLRYITCFTSRVERARAMGKPIGVNGCIGGVFRGEIPHLPFVHYAGPLWLAFASSRYFRARTNHWLEPVISYGAPSGIYDHRSHYLQQSHWTTHPASGLPSRVMYLAAGYERSPKMPEIKSPLPPPFQKGYTNAIYTVDRWMTNAGVCVPKVASLRIFSLYYDPQTGKPSGLKLFMIYKINTHSVRPVSEDLIPQEPFIPTTAFILETRCGPVEFSYLTREGRWLTVEEARRTPEYFAALGKQREKNIIFSVFLTLFLFIIFAPPLLWLAQNWWKQTKPQNGG